MENTVELMNNEVVESVATEVVSEGAEMVSKGLSKGTKAGIVVLAVTAVVGVGTWAYKKIKKAKADKKNATTDENGNVIHTVDSEEESED